MDPPQSKASVQDVTDSVNILTERIVDNHREVDRKVANFPTRAELSEELAKKASQADVLKLGDSKADHGDVQSYMERHKQAWQTVQERIDSGLSGARRWVSQPACFEAADEVAA